MLASRLETKGISYDLQKHYRRNGWIESVGTGAFKRPKENVTWKGGLYALQKQSEIPVYAGGLTALSLLGFPQDIKTGFIVSLLGHARPIHEIVSPNFIDQRIA